MLEVKSPGNVCNTYLFRLESSWISEFTHKSSPRENTQLETMPAGQRHRIIRYMEWGKPGTKHRQLCQGHSGENKHLKDKEKRVARYSSIASISSRDRVDEVKQKSTLFPILREQYV